MTPEEIKAKELVGKYTDIELPNDCSHSSMGIEAAKACAIVCVDEILDQANKILLPRKFWEEVKAAIQKL